MLADAIGNLALRHPQKVLPAIARWFSDPASSRAGINAFLALSSTIEGAKLLCNRAGDPEFADTLTVYFQQAFADNHSSKRAILIARSWGDHSRVGELDSELTTRVFAAALAPSTKGSLFGEFPDVGDYRTYWGRVYHEAVALAARRDREDAAQSDDVPRAVSTASTGRHPEAAGQQPDTGQNGRHTAPADGLDTAPAPAVRARPWIPLPPSPGTHGRIADGGGPQIGLEARPRWSAASASARRKRAVKPSAQPTLVRTQHLPPRCENGPLAANSRASGAFLLCPVVCHLVAL